MLRKSLTKVQTQVLALLIGSTVIPVSLVGGFGIYSSSQALFESAVADQQNHIHEKSEQMQAFLEGVNQDLAFLVNVPPIEGIIRARENGGVDPVDQSSYAVWIQRLNTILIAMVEAKPYYFEVRYIDELGQEMAKVDYRNGQGIVAPNLFKVSTQDYFQGTLRLASGKVYTGPISLYRENNQVVKPFRPIIRYGRPVFDRTGATRGILVISIEAESLLRFLEGNHTEDGTAVTLVDTEGYYVYNEDPSQLWGRDLGHGASLFKDYPEEVTDRIMTEDIGYISHLDQNLLTFSTFYTDAEQKQALKLIHTIPEAVVFQSLTSFKWVAALVLCGSTVGVLGISGLRMKGLRNNIHQLVSQVASACQDIATTMTEQETTAANQSVAVQQTTTTMEQLHANSHQSEQQAVGAVQMSQQALDMAEAGNRSVGEALAGMIEIRDRVHTIAKRITGLNTQAQQIGKISQLVSEIANQTNMLALNAAVEAVRAGENGKGFAVVAAEIRQLADESRQSADNISQIVTAIQNEIQVTEQATQYGMQATEFNMEITQRTAQSFAGVTTTLSDVAFNSQQIFLSLQQQAQAINQIVEAMDILNSGARETATGLNQTRIGTEQLSGAASHLQEMF